MVNKDLSYKLERGYSDEDLRRWEKKWKEFHNSLPDKIVFKDTRAGLTLTLYRKGESGLYTPEPPQKRRRWYWPFYRI